MNDVIEDPGKDRDYFATVIGFSTRSLDEYRRRGQIPSPDYLTPGGRPRWRLSTINAFLARSSAAQPNHAA